MIRHDYPNLHRWLRELYWQNDAFKSTTNFEHIKTHCASLFLTWPSSCSSCTSSRAVR